MSDHASKRASEHALDHTTSGPKIWLQSNDGAKLCVEKAAAQRSAVIRCLLEDMAHEDISEENPIPILNVELSVNESILRKVMTWCDHPKNESDPVRDSEVDRKVEISEWDGKFLDVDQETLFEIILAANYLEVKGLLDVGCKTVANMIKGKSPEQIRETFNITNDFTEAEEKEIQRENEWAEDL